MTMYIKKPNTNTSSVVPVPQAQTQGQRLAATTPVVEAPVVPVVQPPLPVPADLDSLLGLTPAASDQYGPELLAALGKLAMHVEAEGVTIPELQTACVKVNEILLEKPTLATEVMLPEHVGLLCRAAYKLTGLTTEVGKKTKAKSSKTAVSGATQDGLARLASLQAKRKKTAAKPSLLSGNRPSLASLLSTDDDEEF